MALPKCTFPSAVSQRGNALLNIRLPYRSNRSIRSRPLAVQHRLRRRGTGWRSHSGAIYFASLAPPCRDIVPSRKE